MDSSLGLSPATGFASSEACWSAVMGGSLVLEILNLCGAGDGLELQVFEGGG